LIIFLKFKYNNIILNTKSKTMKSEEVKQRYDGFPARIKDENTKITALAKGLAALNKTHASNFIPRF
jgi:hypothetical protein